MINQLGIRNFKSIKDLKISCKKLNVFIGEPNSGKSNIIEALSLRSQNAVGQSLNKDMFRYNNIGDLFYDFNINNPIEIASEGFKTVLKYAIKDDGSPENRFHFLYHSEKNKEKPTEISHDGQASQGGVIQPTNVHFYEYKRLSKFSYSHTPHLSVPHGDNLPSLLLSNPGYKKWVSDFLKSKDLTLTLKPADNELLASKLIDGEIYSYPYFTISETLQRIIFYTIAIKSNKDSIILFDEPESNTFPFYTKFIAERIALDIDNQFFITTHNPYLLLSLIEKSKEENINVCIVQMKDYQTVITQLKQNQVSEVLDLNSDVFFNFDKILSL
ncbi:MAG TPA: hypothetical protein DCY35_07845 [Prolixibacteraceae bacterium]|nr:hypothetical protein [Prolixibacteraceae bacterium]